MLFFVAQAHDIVPAAGIIDVAAAIPPAYQHVGPMLACLDFWLVTADAGSSGGYSAEVRFLDTEGQLRVMSGGAIGLGTPPAGEPLPFSSTGVFMLRRQSPTAQLQIVTGTINPGSAKVAYSLLFGPAAPTDLIALPLIPGT